MMTKTMQKLKFGLVGCGNICRIYLESLKGSPWVEISSCFDLDAAKATKVADEFGLRRNTSFDEMLADSGIDGILNLTLPKAHAEVTRLCIEAGKHCFQEKPFASNLSLGLEMHELLQKTQLRVGCAPANMLSPASVKAAELISSGKIGEVHSVHACWAGSGPDAWHPAPAAFYQKGAGPLFDTGPYPLTDLLHLFGKIREVKASAGRGLSVRRFLHPDASRDTFIPEVDTHVTALLTAETGVRINLTVSFDVASHTQPLMEIYGTSGTLNLPSFSDPGGVIKLYQPDDSKWIEIPLSDLEPWKFGHGLVEFCKSIVENRSSPLDWKYGLHVLAVMEAIQEAALLPGLVPQSEGQG